MLFTLKRTTEAFQFVGSNEDSGKKREKLRGGDKDKHPLWLMEQGGGKESLRHAIHSNDAFPPELCFLLAFFYSLDHFTPNHFFLNSLSLFLPPQYAREITLLPDCCIHRTPGFTHK